MGNRKKQFQFPKDFDMKQAPGKADSFPPPKPSVTEYPKTGTGTGIAEFYNCPNYTNGVIIAI